MAPDLDSEVTMKGLSLLEKGAGIPILTELKANRRDFLQKVQINAKTPLNDALKKWLTKPVRSHIKPTWKNLCLVLCLMKQELLAKSVSRYLSRATKCLLPTFDMSNLSHNVEKSNNQLMDVEYCFAVFYQSKPSHIQMYFEVVCDHHYVGLHMYCMLNVHTYVILVYLL